MKNMIKNYALNLTPDVIIEYALKEGVVVSKEEANLFIRVIHENIDDMINGKALEVLESYKGSISAPSYNKLLELYDKYKKFID